ncbi:hypothetical protein ACQ661_10395 [Pseudidiomarina sp. WS423]|uniref:hypothetical protein n=1 Tax=Pseudidiomarina sp. WS423 TaxID=3425124 RepID=UPI003D6DC89F
MPISLFLLQGLLAALLFYGLVGQHYRQPLWNTLAVLTLGLVPPVNWLVLMLAVGYRLWHKPASAMPIKH